MYVHIMIRVSDLVWYWLDSDPDPTPKDKPDPGPNPELWLFSRPNLDHKKTDLNPEKFENRIQMQKTEQKLESSN